MTFKEWLYFLIPTALFFTLLGLTFHIYRKDKAKKMESAKYKMLDEEEL